MTSRRGTASGWAAAFVSAFGSLDATMRYFTGTCNTPLWMQSHYLRVISTS
jgi:hypothetical protein